MLRRTLMVLKVDLFVGVGKIQKSITLNRKKWHLLRSSSGCVNFVCGELLAYEAILFGSRAFGFWYIRSSA